MFMQLNGFVNSLQSSFFHKPVYIIPLSEAEVSKGYILNALLDWAMHPDDGT